MKLSIILFLAFIIAVFFNTSCSYRKKLTKEGKIYLSSENDTLLNGNFSNLASDTFEKNKNYLFDNFNVDTNIKCHKSLIVNFKIIDLKNIQIKLLNKDSVISVANIKGRFSKGRFNIKQHNNSWVICPILWLSESNRQYIELRKNNSVLFHSKGSGGVIFFILFPIMAGGGSWDIEVEYLRIN